MVLGLLQKIDSCPAYQALPDVTIIPKCTRKICGIFRKTSGSDIHSNPTKFFLTSKHIRIFPYVKKSERLNNFSIFLVSCVKSTELLSRELKGREHLGDLGTNGRFTLKWIF
jgi:hypothetical protein